MRLLEDPQFLKTAAAVCYGVAAVFAVLAIILFFVFDIRGMIRAYREIKEIRRTRKTSDGSKIRQNSKARKTSDGSKIRQNSKTRKISDRSEIRQNNKIRKTRQSIKGGQDSGQRQKESTDRTMTNKKPEKKVNIILAVILAAALLPAWPLSSAAHTVPCTAISSRGYDGKTLSASKPLCHPYAYSLLSILSLSMLYLFLIISRSFFSSVVRNTFALLNAFFTAERILAGSDLFPG